MNRSYIINDVNGNPINEKYPPNKEMYGEEFGGYGSEADRFGVKYHKFQEINRCPCSRFVLLDKICRNHGGWCDNCMENGACH